MQFRDSDGETTIVYPTIAGSGANATTHVALCMGGPSAENAVSRVSAKRFLDALQELGYTITAVDIGRDFGAILPTLGVDLVVNATHGPYGEDGCLPGLLELAAIPYTHSGVLASAICMDKIISRSFFTAHHLPMAEAVIITRDQQITQDPLPRPFVIKPPHLGSSVGVQVIFPEDDCNFATYEWAFGDTMIVEKYIPGREVQVGILDGEALAVGEITTIHKFHDYASKYEDGIATHIVPAPLPPAIYQQLMETALKAHTLLGCRSVSRVDFRYDDTVPGKERFYILEVNTHPGCTPLSLYPEIAEAAGIDWTTLVDRIVKSAGCDSLPKNHPLLQKKREAQAVAC